MRKTHGKPIRPLRLVFPSGDLTEQKIAEHADAFGVAQFLGIDDIGIELGALKFG